MLFVVANLVPIMGVTATNLYLAALQQQGNSMNGSETYSAGHIDPRGSTGVLGGPTDLYLGLQRAY